LREQLLVYFFLEAELLFSIKVLSRFPFQVLACCASAVGFPLQSGLFW